MDFISEGIYRNIKAFHLRNTKKIAHLLLHNFKEKKNNTLALGDFKQSLFRNKNLRTIRNYFSNTVSAKENTLLPPGQHSKLWSIFLLASVNENCVSCVQYLLENIEALKLGISKEEFLTLEDIDGLAALHIAAKNTDLACINMLLQHAPRTMLAKIDADGKIPLYHAILNGADKSMLERLLLNVFMYIPDTLGRNIIHFAVLNCLCEKLHSEKTLKYIIESTHPFSNGSQYLINQKDYIKGYTPLHVAITYHYFQAVKLLLANGADVNIRDSQNRTPLHIATCEQHSEIIELLLEHRVDLNVLDHQNWSPLYLASCYNNWEIVKLFLENGADPNATPVNNDITSLHIAIFNNQLAIIELLLQCGANPNAMQINDDTSLLKITITNHQLAITQLLLEYGADPDTRLFQNNTTPLHLGIRYNSYELTQLFLNKNANVNVINHEGRTPLHIAIHSKNVRMIELLLAQKDIQLNIQDQEGNTPLHVCIIRFNNLKVFKQILKKAQELAPEVLSMANKKGYIPIHLTVYQNRRLFFKQMMPTATDPTLLFTNNTSNGKNLLHTAIERETIDIIKYLQKHFSETVAFLQNTRNLHGKTPIDLLLDIQTNNANKKGKLLSLFFKKTNIKRLACVQGTHTLFSSQITLKPAIVGKRSRSIEEAIIESPLSKRHCL